MKKKIRGWKEGILIQDLRSYGAAMVGKSTEHKKGDMVRYKRFKSFRDDTWTGEYEWHYMDLNNYNLVRSGTLLIKD